ncbi:hypothetical protein FLB_04120 [Flavobacterium succinicans]|uniref:Uncharacterized protein n=1 Tax=Flavobacterium succinicans TaxID=29536 RepID=A0A199XTV4_9FLAO|nr:hypothetical protein FLB_04120 [Flavobacterium succinicans]
MLLIVTVLVAGAKHKSISETAKFTFGLGSTLTSTVEVYIGGLTQAKKSFSLKVALYFIVSTGDKITGIPVAITVWLASASSVQVMSYKPFVAEMAPKVVGLIGQTTGSDTMALGVVILVEIATF